MSGQNLSIREHAFLDPFWLFGHPDNKTGNTGKLSCDFRGSRRGHRENVTGFTQGQGDVTSIDEGTFITLRPGLA